jgi:hypothetical protein
MNKVTVLITAILFSTSVIQAQPVYRTAEGFVHFLSDAPLEKIEASSNKLQGIIDPATNEFAFSLAVSSFQGFNSPLQQEHFNENYLHTDRFPRSTFTGKIIEPVDFSRDSTYEVRAKGTFEIHGLRVERIIKASLTVSGNSLLISARFPVLLAEHDISVPRIVQQKIAETIQVTVNAQLERK